MTLKERIEAFVLNQGNQVGAGAELAAILNDIIDKPLPPASKDTIGGVKVGNGLSVTEQGVLSTKTLIPITWAALRSLRNEGKLLAGAFYRITDYVTTTAQADTQSAGHAFDVIVFADSENSLNENAYAARHEGDTYFESCKLEAWELKYCLDNDTDRFAWADTENGKGVIFYMKDEWANECPYDFKNILSKRSAEWFNGHEAWCEFVLGSTPEADMYFYTFSWVNEDGGVEDLTIVGQTLPNDEGGYEGVHGNKIGECTEYAMGIQTGEEESTRLALSENAIVGSYAFEQGIFYGCYSNTFGNDCYSNTFGNDCYSNTFGNGCYSNTFGNGCYYNTFGNYCYSNTFGNYCSYNTFGNGCSSNTFGTYCSYNTFGNGCSYNTFGNDCSYNTFGNDCTSNTFGNGCTSNTFGTSQSEISNNITYVTVYPKTTGVLNFAANKGYPQFAGLDSTGTLKIWTIDDIINA